MPTSIKVLDVGSGPESVAKVALEGIGLENLEVTRLDASPDVNPDILHNITEPLPEELHGAFDIVYCSHVLEHIESSKVVQAAVNVTRAVRNGGEVWFLVPSLEWAATEVIKERDHQGVQLVLFGSQDNPWQYHKCAFTLNALRYMAEVHCGLIVRRAHQAVLLIRRAGAEFQALQNIVVGMRYDWQEDEAFQNGKKKTRKTGRRKK